MQLNHLPDEGDGKSLASNRQGDLKVSQQHLTKIGNQAFELYNQLQHGGKVARTSTDGAATDFSTQGFELGDALSHVSVKWDSSLNDLLDACAHISNHMDFTKKAHAGDEVTAVKVPMTPHFRRTRRGSTRVLLLGVAVLAGLTACSSDNERAYALPDKLCGTPVTPATLEPLLPGGDKLSQSKDALGDSRWCGVDIDSKSAMSTRARWYNADTTPRRAATMELGVSPMDTPEGNDIIHGRTGAVARVECPAAKKSDVMYVSMRLVDRKVAEKDTLAFIRSYAKGIQQTERCAGKPK